MNSLRELYQEVIIDHSKHPHNFGTLENATHEAEGFNPLCGDKLTLYLKIDHHCVKEAKFIGQGCAISTASASLMTDAIKNKNTQEILDLFDGFHQLVTKNTIPANLGKLEILSGIREFPMRVKCATLAWHTLKSAIENNHTMVTTE